MKDALKRLIASVSITVSILSLTVVFLYIGNNDINRHAIAQLTTQNPFPNNTETIESLDKLLGNNTAIILSDTHISNPSNTLLDSININIKEDCMKLPNSEHLYCPWSWHNSLFLFLFILFIGSFWFINFVRVFVMFVGLVPSSIGLSQYCNTIAYRQTDIQV